MCFGAGGVALSDQRGFFDLGERYGALSKAGDPLERLSAVIDFELFRSALDAALKRSDRAKGGRPPMDAVMMFKALIVRTLYGLSDEQTEFQIMDRRTFGRFLGLDDGDKVPGATTLWRFREALTEAKAIEALFARFNAHLKESRYLAIGGQIIDASIVAAPRQRMSDEEREIVKGGGTPPDWEAKPAKLARKEFAMERQWSERHWRMTRAGRSGAANAAPTGR